MKRLLLLVVLILALVGGGMSGVASAAPGGPIEATVMPGEGAGRSCQNPMGGWIPHGTTYWYTSHNGWRCDDGNLIKTWR